MAATTSTANAVAPLRSPWLTVLVSWLIPGAGHLMLGRRGRGAIIAAAVFVSFAIGLLMRGPLFQVTGGGDVLSRLIQWGGLIGDLASGLLYFVSTWLGYGPMDRAGHTGDYGAKFLVAAGLLNILAMVDAYEIATRQKE
ncbi:MAG: hypothetical protein M3Y27_09860 [Acidobacteriota bacterium]|nr:hypothetical protein [Acidobacteriota bacterium]